MATMGDEPVFLDTNHKTGRRSYCVKDSQGGPDGSVALQRIEADGA